MKTTHYVFGYGPQSEPHEPDRTDYLAPGEDKRLTLAERQFILDAIAYYARSWAATADTYERANRLMWEITNARAVYVFMED